MVYKLDLLDKKLITELDINSRQTTAQLARKLKKSQQVISYRINKLVENKIITNFMTAISTRYVGLSVIAKLYIQYKGISENDEDNIHNYLEKHKDVNWICKTLGDFDLFTAVMVKDLDSFIDFKREFFGKFAKFINNYEVSFLDKAYTFSRTYLLDKKGESIKPRLIHKPLLEKISRKDMEILSILADNSRINVLDIANKTKFNVKTIISRIKQLEKDGAIQGYRIQLNRKNIGWKYYKIFIKVSSFNNHQYSNLLNYLLSQKYLLHLIECIGKYEIELEIEVPETQIIQDLAKNIRNRYADSIENIVVTEILDETKLTWLPPGFLQES